MDCLFKSGKFAIPFSLIQLMKERRKRIKGHSNSSTKNKTAKVIPKKKRKKKIPKETQQFAEH